MTGKKNAGEAALQKKYSALEEQIASLEARLAQNIQARELAEGRLTENDRLFHTLFETMAQGVVFQDSDGLITRANPAAEQILGLSAAQMQGRTSMDPRWKAIREDGTGFPGEMHPAMIAMKSGEPVNDVIMGVFHPLKNELRWILVNAVPLFQDGQQNPVEVYTTFTDVTESQRARESLRQSEERFNQLVFSLDEIIYTLDVNQRHIGVFGKWVSDTGLTEDYFLGKSARDLFGEEGAQIHEQSNLRALQGEHVIYEWEIRNPGLTLYYETSLTPLRDAQGKIIGLTGIGRNITQQKLAADQLRQSQARLEMALKGANAGLWDWNIQTGELTVNERWCELVGYSMAELAPINIQTWFDLCHPDDLKKSLELNERHFRKETEDYSCEMRLKHRNGAWVWVSDHGRVVEWDAAGKPLRMAGTHIDINARATAAADMIRSEQRLRSMIDSAMDAIVTTDAKRNIVTFNAAAETMFGISTASALGQPISILLPEHFRTRHGSLMSGLVAGRPEKYSPGQVFPITGLRSNGEEFPAESTFSFIEINGEQFFTAILRDVTERKNTEKALRQSEDRFRSIFEASRAIMLVIEPDSGGIINANQAAAEFYGYSQAQLISMNIDEINTLPPDEIALERQRAKTEARNYFVFPHRLANGQMRTVEVRSTPIKTRDQTLLFSIISDITERQQAENALRASEEKYRGLMESLNSVIATIDLEGRYIYLNDLAARQLGGTPEELTGKTLFDLFPEPVAQQQMDALRDSVDRDESLIYENQSLWLGKLRWFRTTIQPLHNEEGRVNQLLVNATDIDDLKRLQSELQELNRTLEDRVRQRTAEVQDLYDNAPCGYHSLDTQGRFVMINQTEVNWLGYSREEIIGHPITEFITPESLPRFHEAFSQFLKQGWARDVEFTYQRKDGSRFPILLNASAVYDSEGRIASSRSTILDITERKQIEIALHDSEARLSFLLSHTPAIIFTLGLTPDFPITYISNSVRESLGYENRQFMEDPLFWRSLVHPEDQKSRLQAIQKTRETGSSIWEARIRTASGRYLWMSHGMTLLHDKDGRPQEIIGYTINVDEAKKAQLALEESEAQLRQSRDELAVTYAALASAGHAKDEFLANMSHELRTPLNGILGLAEILLDGYRGPLNEHQHKFVRTIDTSGRHLLSLINDILDLSKVESGKMDFNPERVPINELCQASMAFVREQAIKKSLTLRYMPEAGLSTIWADSRRMKQILINLLNNAVKFTPPNGGILLEVSSDAQKDCIEFSVSDTGIGISPEDLQRLFTPFTQVDSSLTRQHEGTGLGLVLVKRLAELQGGSVRVTSQVGQGSCFTVSLPGKPTADQNKPFAKPGTGSLDERVLQTTAPLSTGTILFAEDNAINRMSTSDYLESIGYTLVTASTGVEALRLADKTSPDVILMDIQMPELDGLSAIHRLRADPRFEKTPIIALTALAMAGDLERCLEAGANAYLSKPYSLKELAKLIEEHLRGAK